MASITFKTAPASSVAVGWPLACQLNYTRDTWVKLVQPPSPYADDEAKLLCQQSAQAWLAWVPGHGEVLLDRSHFYG